jgi:GNAT superfamily N-acetyltransferase
LVRATLSLATIRDVDILVAHRHKLFEEIRPRTPEEHRIADRSYKGWATKLMKQGKLVGFIMRNRVEPVASGCVWLRENPPYPGRAAGPRPYLLSMYTEPAYRGRGYACRIVREAMRWSKKNGYTRMALHASEMGRSLYKKLGWERTWEMQAYLVKPTWMKKAGKKKSVSTIRTGKPRGRKKKKV